MSSASNPLVTPQKRRSARDVSSDTFSPASSSSSSSPSSTLSSPTDTLILTPASASSTSHACPFSPGTSTIKRIKLNVTPTKSKSIKYQSSSSERVEAIVSDDESPAQAKPQPRATMSKSKAAQAAVTARRLAGPGPSPLKNAALSFPAMESMDNPSTPSTPSSLMTPSKVEIGRVREGSPGLTFFDPIPGGVMHSTSGSTSTSITSRLPIPPSTPPRTISKSHITPNGRASSRSQAQPRTLPPHLQTFLLLNNALDLALSLHMAMHPPLLPTSTTTSNARLSDSRANTTSRQPFVDLQDTANFLNLKGIVEQTSSRRFGVGELRRLIWIWGWGGSGSEGKGVGAEDEGLGIGMGMGRKRKRTISAGEDDEGIEMGSGSSSISKPSLTLSRTGNKASGKPLIGGLSDDEEDDDDSDQDGLGSNGSPTKSKGRGKVLMKSLKDTSSAKTDRNPFLLDDEDEDDFVIPSPSRRAAAKGLFSGPSTSTTTHNDDRDTTNTISFPHHALSHILTATRTVDPATNRRTYTYGFGIRIALTAMESMEMGPGPTVSSGSASFDALASDSASRSGARERLTMTNAAGEVTSSNVKPATRWVGRWSAGSEKRSKEVERRLWDWVERNGGTESPPSEDDEDLGPRRREIIYTPSSSTGATAIVHPLDHIPQIPMAILPTLPTSPASGLLPAFTLPGLRQAQAQTSLGPAFGSLSPRKTLVDGMGHSRQGSGSGIASASAGSSTKPEVETDVFGPVQMIPQKKVVAGSVADRRQAMYDRIKARQGGGAGVPSGGGGKLGSGGLHANMSTSERQTELKRMSTLSRLEGIAEGVWMFFSNGPAGGVGFASLGSPGSPKARRRAFPMHEVVDIVVKSSKTPISSAEAKDSLALLTDLCPTFLVKRVIARQEWLEMPAQNQVVPASPKKDFAGPASPGKVTGRTMGLREVRERIRKELGEW